jgi:hypothetical protein
VLWCDRNAREYCGIQPLPNHPGEAGGGAGHCSRRKEGAFPFIPTTTNLTLGPLQVGQNTNPSSLHNIFFFHYFLLKKMPARIKEFTGLLALFKKFLRTSHGATLPVASDEIDQLPGVGIPISLMEWDDDESWVPAPVSGYVLPNIDDERATSPEPPSPSPSATPFSTIKKRVAAIMDRPVKKSRKL